MLFRNAKTASTKTRGGAIQLQHLEAEPKARRAKSLPETCCGSKTPSARIPASVRDEKFAYD
jgi:hypothetical protein